MQQEEQERRAGRRLVVGELRRQTRAGLPGKRWPWLPSLFGQPGGHTVPLGWPHSDSSHAGLSTPLVCLPVRILRFPPPPSSSLFVPLHFSQSKFASVFLTLHLPRPSLMVSVNCPAYVNCPVLLIALSERVVFLRQYSSHLHFDWLIDWLIDGHLYWLIDGHLYSAILRSLEQTHCARLWFYMSDKLSIARFLFCFVFLYTEVVYLQRWHGWCHMKLQPSRRKFCVHHTTMHHVTSRKATYVWCMRV